VADGAAAASSVALENMPKWQTCHLHEASPGGGRDSLLLMPFFLQLFFMLPCLKAFYKYVNITIT